MRYTISLFAVLAFIWLANSGHYSPLLLGFGLLSVVFVVFVAHRMNIVDSDSQPLHLLLALPGYYWWLFRKILRSNLEVVACVWRGSKSLKVSLKPASARITTSLRGDLARALYANSITLTPGTVAVDIDGDEILVHALTADSLEDLRRGEMEARINGLGVLKKSC
ncbi:Na+/H+ antiporter subunit E [Microbulbifer taiwanensis]|uniref:Na+/H+ antiporter subunit E n=2 Tax=Microbulbifer taiwanensis TaxID=986746 RepID=A0ABW1YSH1_9GAMM|nr:Na+/H+ antiporter subunit E [Microbulbifer taiwanensis]